MALIRCKDCGHEISDKANVCPKCGNKIAASSKKDNGSIKIIGAVLVVALLIGGGILFLNKRGGTNVVYAGTANKTENTSEAVCFTEARLFC